MSTNLPEPLDRLDRIERILEGVAIRQDVLSQQQELLSRQQELITQQIQETRVIADSNARAIEALANHTAEARDIAEQDRSELRVAVNELIQESRENIAQHLSFREEIQQLRDRVDGG